MVTATTHPKIEQTELRLDLGGMTCASCAARVEKKLNKLAGVTATVNFATEKAAGGVPAHFWIPDVAEGSSAPAAAFLATVPKIGAFAALFRLLTTAIPVTAVDWPLLAAVLAAATM